MPAPTLTSTSSPPRVALQPPTFGATGQPSRPSITASASRAPQADTAKFFGKPPAGKAVAPQFGGNAKEPSLGQKIVGGVGRGAKGALLGTLGLSSALVCWPLALGATVLGVFIHPLLLVAVGLGLAPFALGLWGAIAGAKKSK